MGFLHNELGTLGARKPGGIELGMMDHHIAICIVDGIWLVDQPQLPYPSQHPSPIQK
jgi:hypothetical protein